MITQESAIAALNDLLSAEQCNLAPKLVEADVFVSEGAVRAAEIVHRMADASRRNCEQLVDLVIELGSEPRPTPCDVSTANLHYQELGYVLPQLVRAHEELLRQYTDARPQLAGHHKAMVLVSQVLMQHERDLASLKELAVHSTGAAR